MTSNLRILILEDDPNDADLLNRELKRSGLSFTSEIVQTRTEFEHALQHFNPDLILSDYSLPSFDAAAAFRIKQNKLPNIPFIIISGVIGEENAVDLIKNGVTDYAFKDKLFTLSSKINRALKDSEEWKEKQINAEKLKIQAATLIVANKELAFQNEEKEKRGEELIIANEKLNKSAELLQENLREIFYYKYALDESSIIAITDQKGIIKKVNSNFCKITKYSEEELIGQDHRIINSGYHTQEFMRDLWVTIANGKIWKGELKNKAKDGNFYWVDTTIVPFLDEQGKPYQYLAIRADITDRKEAEEYLIQHTAQLETANKELAFQNEEKEKRAAELVIANIELAFQNEEKEKRAAELVIANIELAFQKEEKEKRATELIIVNNELVFQKELKKNQQALAESENHLLTIFQTEAECIKLLGINGELENMNPAGLAMIEADSLGQIKGKSLFDIIDKPYRKAFNQLTKNVFKGKSGILEFEITGLKGASRWLETHAVPLKDVGGKIIFLLGITRDITDRKKTEKEILRVIERYDILARATSDTIWDWDITNDKILYNEGITNMFGYGKIEIENIVGWWEKKIHPDDLQIVSEAFVAAFKKQSYKLQLEYRFRCADESFKYIYDRSFIIYDEHKKPCKIIGAMQDVSKIKENEISLNELNKNLQKQAKELSISNEELEEQNHKLQDIAWIQSHIVRAPLARMLGIVNIIKDLTAGSPDYEEWINHFITSANELDNIIKDIVDKTENIKTR